MSAYRLFEQSLFLCLFFCFCCSVFFSFAQGLCPFIKTDCYVLCGSFDVLVFQLALKNLKVDFKKTIHSILIWLESGLGTMRISHTCVGFVALVSCVG